MDVQFTNAMVEQGSAYINVLEAARWCKLNQHELVDLVLIQLIATGYDPKMQTQFSTGTIDRDRARCWHCAHATMNILRAKNVLSLTNWLIRVGAGMHSCHVYSRLISRLAACRKSTTASPTVAKQSIGLRGRRQRRLCLLFLEFT